MYPYSSLIGEMLKSIHINDIVYTAAPCPPTAFRVECYLKGLKEASASAPVFQFVILSSDAHHCLAVHMELLIQGL